MPRLRLRQIVGTEVRGRNGVHSSRQACQGTVLVGLDRRASRPDFARPAVGPCQRRFRCGRGPVGV